MENIVYINFTEGSPDGFVNVKLRCTFATVVEPLFPLPPELPG
jgi:hypothetical protein